MARKYLVIIEDIFLEVAKRQIFLDGKTGEKIERVRVYLILSAPVSGG